VDDKDHAVDFEMKDNPLKTELINIYNKYIDTFLVLVAILCVDFKFSINFVSAVDYYE